MYFILNIGTMIEIINTLSNTTGITSSLYQVYSFEFITRLFNNQYRVKLGKLDFIIITSIILLSNFFHIYYNLRILIYILLSSYYYVKNYNVSKYTAFIQSSGYWIVVISISIVSIILTSDLFNIDTISELSKDSKFKTTSIILRIILLTLVRIIISIRCRITKSESIDFSSIIICICVKFTLLFGIYFYTLDSRHKEVSSKTIFFTEFILYIIPLLSLILAISIVNQTIKRNKEVLFIKKKLENDFYEYKLRQDNEDNIRRIYHDMKNHIICIKGLYNNQQDALNYLLKLEKSINNSTTSYNSGNRVVDILLNEKSSTCERKGIKFTSIVNAEKINFIDDIDICTIFSNIIDNAIESSENDNINEKFINISSYQKKEFYIFKCINNKSHDILKKNKAIQTSKKEFHRHGYGLKNIKSTIEKYNGSLDIDYNDNEFILSFIIPLKERKV